METFEFAWDLENAFYINPKTVFVVESPEFELPTIRPIKWTLGYCNKTVRNDEGITIYLKRLKGDEYQKVVNLSYYLAITKDDLVVAETEACTVPFDNGDVVSNKIEIEYDKITKYLKSTLAIRWNVTEINYGTTICKSEILEMEKLSEDIKSLFEDAILTDVVLKSNDRDVKAHKSVLWALCPSLLELAGPDSEQSQVLEMSENTLKILLRYAYSGCLDNLIPMAVLNAVEKYKITPLIRFMTAKPLKLNITSRTNEYTVYHEMTIKNVEGWQKDNKVISQVLTLGETKISRWRLIAEINPTQCSSCDCDEIDLYLQCVYADTSDCFHLGCKVTTVSASGKTCSMTFYCYIRMGEKYKCPIFAPKKLVCDGPTKPSDFKFKCRFTCSDGTMLHLGNEARSKGVDQLAMYKMMSSYLRDLYTSGSHSDVLLRLCDSVFPAHKAILSARSPVFNRMFQSDMIEKKTGEVTITDLIPEAFGLLLEYIYTGEVETKCEETIMDLYVAADKYEVLSLKEQCAEFLKERLNSQNASKVRDLAFMHGDETLTNAAQIILDKQEVSQ